MNNCNDYKRKKMTSWRRRRRRLWRRSLFFLFATHKLDQKPQKKLQSGRRFPPNSASETKTMTMGLILSSLLLCFIAVPLFLFRSLRGRPELNLPPGPAPLPFIGNLHQLGKLSPRSLLRMARDYGPLLHLNLGSVRMLVVSSAEMAEEIFKRQDSVFCNRPTRKFTMRFSRGGHGVAFGFYGEGWRQLRKISTLALYTAKRVQSSRSAREEELRLFLKTIAETSAAGQLVNVSDMALCLFSNITCRLVFGRRSSKDGKCRRIEFQDRLREGINLLGEFCPSDFFPSMGLMDRLTGFHGRLEKTFGYFDSLMEEEIAEHLKRDDEEDRDLTSVLLRLQRDSYLGDGFELSREGIKSILWEVLLGGSDTSAATIESGMLQLILNPRVMKKAQEEVRRVAGEKPIVEESDLPELVYLKTVIMEIFRRRPPGPLLLPRESIRDTRICGYDIPAKTTVLVNAWAIMRESSLWKDAEDFCPERFQDTQINYRGQDFRFMPFGSGRRICPAINLALASVELALANLLHCFDWTLPDGMKPQDVDTREASGIVLRLENPLSLRATARHGWCI